MSIFAPTPLAPGALLCAYCVFYLSIPASCATATPQGGPEELLKESPGPWLVEAARRARDEGQRVDLNSQRGVGIYADLTHTGTTVCTGHLWELLDAHRQRRPVLG